MEARPAHWLPVIGWEGLYEVSDRGEVRSLDRWIPQQQRLFPGRVLKPGRDGHYLFVHLCYNGKSVSRKVHSLVLEAFAEPRPAGLEACHGPGGKLDNRWPENLSWGTKDKNLGPDKVRDGTAWWTDPARRDAKGRVIARA